MLNPANQSVLPAGIADKHDVVFGNMEEIHDFHRKFVVVDFLPVER